MMNTIVVCAYQSYQNNVMQFHGDPDEGEKVRQSLAKQDSVAEQLRQLSKESLVGHKIEDSQKVRTQCGSYSPEKSSQSQGGGANPNSQSQGLNPRLDRYFRTPL